MKCKKLRINMDDILDGRAPGAEVLAHISACEDCGREYRAALKIKEALMIKEKTDIPGNFNKGVWEKAGISAPSVWGGFLPARPEFLRHAAAAAAAVFLVFYLGSGLNYKEEPVKYSSLETEETGGAAQIREQAPCGAETEKGVLITGAQDIREKREGEFPSARSHTVYDREGGAGYSLKREPLFKGEEKIVRVEEDGAVRAASIQKKPAGEDETPVLIKNNVIKPAEGQAMTVRYSLNEAVPVTIIVYNRRGEPVKTLVNSEQGPGVY
ncbi:MAG TPA: hypothetical protein ENN43_06850, partial [bacterium]|nr:hypothetical protein [bacterium]